jgi:hypothetical protein
MEGTLDQVKIRVRTHNPQNIIEREFSGTKSVKEAISFLEGL